MEGGANATAIRGKDWIFNAIWSSCGVEKAPRCIMHMPISFLFRNGEPFKALMTDEDRGEVVRVNMDNVDLEEKDTEGIRGPSNRRIRVMRKLVIDYMEYHNYFKLQTPQTKRVSKNHNTGKNESGFVEDDGEPYVISIIYQDGEREDVSLRTLDVLLRNETWRPQILIVQAYVPSLSIQGGRYSMDGEKKVRSLLEKEGAEAADKVTRALAKYSEQAYRATQGSVLGVQPGISKFTGELLEVKLTVTEMHASFALDPNDKCVFLYSDYTMVDLDSGRREAEKFLTKEKAGREVVAARAVYKELKGLLVHAMKRGLSAQESFDHFDVNGTGFVDTDLLIDGLARLGVGVTYPVGEQLLQLIGGIGNNFLGAQDFERYLKDKSADDFVTLDGSGSEAGASRIMTFGSESSMTSPNYKKSKSSRRPDADNSAFFPPAKPGSLPPLDYDDMSRSMGSPGSTVTHDFSSLAETQKYEWDDSAMYGTTGTRSGAKSTSAKKVLSKAKQDASSAAKATAQSFDGSDLPAPLDDYNIKPHVREEATTLHPLASKRNQRALKELRSGHDKWVKKKEGAKIDAAGSGSNINLAETMPREQSPPRALSRGGSRSGKRTPAKSTRDAQSKSSVDPLTLTSIVREMNSQLNRSPDELCHIDSGVIMTYRMLQGQGLKDIRTKEETDALRNRSIYEDKEKKMEDLGMLEKKEADATEGKEEEKEPGYESETDAQGNPIPKNAEKDPRDVDRWVAFTLVIVPDLFMTLDTLQTNFEPLLTKYPHSRIVLVGLPGSPNTVWPNGWVLNSDLHARSIAKLMQFLKQKKKLSPMVGEPIYMMGFGLGVQSLSRFMALYSPGLPWLDGLLRAVIMVNGLLKFNKAFKTVCKDLRSSLLTAGGHEVNELITTLHFNDDYIFQDGNVEIRAKILRRFWETRRGLMSEQPEGGQYPVSKAGLGYVGVLEQLKGILTSPDAFDGAQMLVATTVPVLVVQCTEDVFVNPRNAAIYQADKLPPERTLVTNLVDSLDENAVHVSWLKAGHEVIQERTSFLLGMVSNLAQMCGVHPVAPEKKAGDEEEEEDIFDVIALAESKKKAKLKEIADAKAAKEEEEKKAEEAKKEAKRLKKEEKQRKKDEEAAYAARMEEEAEKEKVEAQLQLEAEAAEAAAEELRKKESEQAAKDADDEDERKVRNAAEKDRRGKLAAERKKRELKAARRAEMEQFYERERLEKEMRGEKKEEEKMEKEDRRSRFAAEYQKSLDNNARSKRIAAAKAEALRIKRREEAIKRVEEKLNRDRAVRSEERRKKAEESVRKILSEFLVLSGEADGGYDIKTDAKDPNGIFSIISSCHKIMHDLLECREKQVESMKRQQLVEQKFHLFRTQLTSVDHEVRLLRRAIRLIELNPAIVGAKEGDPEPDELHELKRNLANKEESYLELTSVAKSRQDQLSAANLAVQKLKLVTRERDELMQFRITEMQNIEENLSNKAKFYRNEKERVSEARDKMKLKEVVHSRRFATLTKEREKMRGHKGKTIDTDAWVEGVMQRSQTKELRAHLKDEAKAESAKVEEVRAEMREAMEQMFKLEDDISRSKRDSDKIGIACKSFMREYKKFNSVPLSDLMSGLVTSQTVAAKTDEKKERDAKLRALQDDTNAEKAAEGQTFDAVEDVRTKDYELRTKDERRFVGLDLVMNPEAYLHVSMVEAEQMRFDEDYQCELLKSDLDRINNLPEQINLAMPFLHTPKEVEAHRLLNFYWRAKDDSFFRQKDFMYQENGEEETVIEDQDDDPKEVQVKPSDMHEAEVVHDVLCKLARRDRVRGKGAGDSYTQSEADWQFIDKILNPEIYNIHHREDDIAHRPVVKDLTFNAVYMQNMTNDGSKVTPVDPESKSHQKTKHNPLTAKDPAFDGNLFQESRYRYEDGEKVFDDTWRCPFTREELLAIRALSDLNHCSEDELRARRLLDVYYVSENESIMGNARLKSMYSVTKRISNFIVDSEKEAKLEAKAKRIERAVLRGVPDEPQSKEDEEESQRDREELAEIQKRMATEDGSDINRIWGSWDQVHPASGGIDSQTSYFLKSAFDASRDHPANYGLHDEAHWLRANAERTNSGGGGGQALPENPAELQELSMQAISALPGSAPTTFDVHDNDPSSEYMICDNLKELALMEVRRVKGKIVLLANPEPLCVFETKEATLQSRQSRSHRFEIPNRDEQKCLDITVSIVFQGNFANKGYKLGRLAAGLFRLPDERDKSANPMPVSVGFSPYQMQSPNLPETLGRVVIMHRPKRRPIKAGFFQIVIGVASNTKYSIDVSCKVAKSALPVVDAAILKAKEMQARLPNVLHELDDLQESLRLAERKLLVCQKMIDEAQLEMDQSQSGMGVVSHKLEIDDEEMTLLEDERRELERELAILEVEYMQWSGLYASRNQELDDIKEGIKLIFDFQRKRINEKKKLKAELDQARHDCPACIAALRGITEATNVATTLNTTVQGASTAWAASRTGSKSKGGGPSLVTPADDVRRRVKREGFNHMVVEEQQWCLLDQAMNPHKYEWLKEQEEEDAEHRLAMGKLPKKKKYPPAVEAFKLPRSEIVSILKTPFAMLSRKEVVVRKLMVKYHDDPSVLKRSFAAAAYGFDPHRAERTRAKMPATYSQEEREWSTIDRILHPEVWAFYVNHDRVTGMDRKKKESEKKGPIEAGTGMNKGGAEEAKKEASTTKKNAVGAMAKILGVGDAFDKEMGGDGFNVTDMINGAQKNLSNQEVMKTSSKFQCSFTKDKIMQIWRTAKHKLASDDERHTFKLLQKYNGAYEDYMEAIAATESREKNNAHAGSHIKWDVGGATPTHDIDLRARLVLNEIDRAANTTNAYMSSDVLHTSDQMFPTPVLRIQLEEELDRILGDQIKDRERAMRLRIDSDSESDDDSDDDVEMHMQVDPSLEGEEKILAERDIMEKVKKRAKRREKRKEKLKDVSVEEEIIKVKKKLDVKGKTGKELEEMQLINQLGFGGCLACRSNPCQWKACVDTETVGERIKILDKESERVRLDKDSRTIISDIALSAQLGGNRIFKRLDLLDELSTELKELERHLHLNDVDRELHEAYSSRKEFVEVKSLHGYSMMLWTNNARVALEARQSRMVAYTVAKDVVNDILDYMLEGWFFGERESSFNVLGLVPSVADGAGYIRAGQDQINAAGAVIKKIRKRKDAKKSGVLLDEQKQGTMVSKSASIQAENQIELKRQKVARDGNRHEHMLNETEQTLRFGLFMLALMYFRAMTFLRREKKSWSGEGDAIAGGKKVKMMTDERMQMVEEENKAAARKKKVDLVLARCKVGDARRREREDGERREAIMELQRVVRRQKLEFGSVLRIQRVYRGHLGRKAAKRWALKRAELGAMNALLNATATCIQRCYRGYIARVLTIRTRAEMAQFIALMRAQEAQADEEVFWETHPWQRFKRDQKEWTDKKLRSAHKTEILGGARLSEEEEVALKESALEEIEDQLDDDDSDEDNAKPPPKQAEEGAEFNLDDIGEDD